MADGGNDLAPHVAIIQVAWEVHERKNDGSYCGGTKDKANHMFVINGNDRALTLARIDELIDLIKRNTNNVITTKFQTAGLGKPQIPGAGGPRQNNANVLGLRREASGDSSSGPEIASDV